MKRGKTQWLAFYVNGIEKCAYTLFGSFDGELENTKELIAYENNVPVSEVEVRMIVR